MSTPDIRKGYLVKATNRQHPEEVRQGRVVAVSSNWVDLQSQSFQRDRWDVEVLDRPLPPINEELIVAVRRAWTGLSDLGGGPFREDWIRVINTVREYDKNNTKENA